MLAIGDPFFERHGPKAVFLGRWIAGLRIWASWLAGASAMRWRTFFVWNALGGIAWATSVALAAYFGGSASRRCSAPSGSTAIIAAGVARRARDRLLVWWRRRKRRTAPPG